MNRTQRINEKELNLSEWQKLYYKHQKQYVRKRLEAIKNLHEKKPRKEVMQIVGCAEKTLTIWIDIYLEKGLAGLVEPIKHNKPQKLSVEQKQQLKTMLLEQKPTDYGIERQIWTGKIIVEVIAKIWNVELKDSRIYQILDEMGLSHQKAHRDYENADSEVQKEFVSTIKKKLEELQTNEKFVFYDEFAVYDRPSLYYAWAEKNTKPTVPSNEKRQRHKLNGMLAVDAVTGEIYLQLRPKCKAEDVAAYLVDLCQDAIKDNCTKIYFTSDNNSTHKQKMKTLFATYLADQGLTDKIEVEFIHTPAYSPNFNLAEYQIHLLRLEKLHHLPSSVTIEQIQSALSSLKHLMNPEQISRTLQHIFKLSA